MRTKGSKNKPKTEMRTVGITLDKQIEGVAISRPSGLSYVKWGANNDYPFLLLDLYANSPTHAACVNFAIQSILGDGIDYEKSNLEGTDIVPNYYQNWDELLRSVATDFIIYGSYAVQVILGNDGKTISYFHFPLEKVRWAEYDEDGQITSYWISNDWSAVGQNPPFEVEAFDMREETKIVKGRPYLYVYRPYSPLTKYYTSPKYVSAIKAIQSEIEYINYDLKSTINGFTPSGIVVLNDVDTDEERKAIIANISHMFQGSDNANSVMVTFRNNVEEAAPTFVPFAANTGNVNLYDSANGRTINRILAAHQINSPQLIGLPVGNTGFNSEGKLLETAYDVYMKVCGNYNRNCVVTTFNSMLRLQGIDTELVLKPMTFVIDEKEEVVKTPTTDNGAVDERVSEDRNGKEVTEKVEQK